MIGKAPFRVLIQGDGYVHCKKCSKSERRFFGNLDINYTKSSPCCWPSAGVSIASLLTRTAGVAIAHCAYPKQLMVPQKTSLHIHPQQQAPKMMRGPPPSPHGLPCLNVHYTSCTRSPLMITTSCINTLLLRKYSVDKLINT